MASASTRRWDPPSSELAELLERAVLAMLERVDAVLEDIDAASFEVNRELLELAPGLADALRAAGRSNVVTWATANLQRPGAPVPANLSPENLDFARDVVRHGFDETILSGFRVSQNVAMRAATDVAFSITSDHELLRELLDLVARSVSAFVEDTLEGITATIRAERAQLRDAASAARAEAVALILEGAPISERRASQLLSYEVARTHVAVIVWSEDDHGGATLEAATRDLAKAAGATRPLTLAVGPSTLWVWLSGAVASEVGTRLRTRDSLGGVRMAVGRPAAGLVGFRKSHLEAAATQRLARRLPLRHPVTLYDDVEVVALASGNEDQARDFVTRTLGPLVDAPVEIRETLRTYLRQECSLTRTAQADFTHRNTVAARLDRARDLLPRDLRGTTLDVALALELAGLLLER